MPTTYTNGLKLPDLGSIDWYNAYKNNIDILDPIVGTVNGVATTYAPISHNHDASEITSGTIDIARLPPAALERLTTVADQTTRYALTTSTVQLGDTVKQLDTGIMYLVVDTTKLNSADGYVEYSAGTASKAIADEDGTSIKTGYGKLVGNQTWNGIQTYYDSSKLVFQHPRYASGTTPATDIFWQALMYGTSGSAYCASYNVAVRSSGISDISFRLNSQTSNTLTGFVHETNADASDISFRPIANGTHNLGSSSYQWSSVYAQGYYYNGTAWGLDKANVWSGNNTFTQSVFSNSGFWTAFTDLQAKNQSSLTSTQVKKIGSDSSDDKSFNKFEFRVASTYTRTAFCINYYNTSGSIAYDFVINQDVDNQGNKSFYPSVSGTSNLGTSTNKWKTLNGINPGALSLPKNANNASFNIDTTNWTTDGSIISYTPLLDGWIYINARNDDTNGDSFIIFDDGVSGFGTSVFGNKGLPNNGIGLLCLMMPVNKNNGINIRIKCPGIISARLYPCNGNV